MQIAIREGFDIRDLERVVNVLKERLQSIPIEYSVHVWFDAERFNEGDVGFLLKGIHEVIEAIKSGKIKNIPVELEHLNARILIQKYRVGVPSRIYVVPSFRAKTSE